MAAEDKDKNYINQKRKVKRIGGKLPEAKRNGIRKGSKQMKMIHFVF